MYETCTFSLFCADPTCFKEASTKIEWRNAMKKDLAAIKKNETRDFMDIPEGENVIGLK